MWDNHRQLNRLSRALLLVWFVLLVVAGWHYIKQRADWFPVKTVKVQSKLTNVTLQQVQLVVDSFKTSNFFGLDIDRMHQAFESLPWVDQVSLRRAFQDRLIEVEIVEHKPFARWGDEGILSEEGKIFHAVMDAPLPVLNGPENAELLVFEQYKTLNAILRKADLQIDKLTLSDRFSWQLVTSNGMTVEIGTTPDVVVNTQRFVEIYHASAGEWHGKIQYVDLRYRDGFAIRRPSKGNKQPTVL